MDNWIFFTLDETLIDDRLAEERAAQLILNEVLGIKVAKAKGWAKLWNYNSQRLHFTAHSDDASIEHIWQSSFREFDPSLTNEECVDLLKLFRAEYFRHLGTFPEVPEVLFRLIDNHKLALIIPQQISLDNNQDIPAGLGSLFQKIIHLSKEMGKTSNSILYSVANHLRGIQYREASLISASYNLLSNFNHSKRINPIWINRLSSKQASSFKTITNLKEIL